MSWFLGWRSWLLALVLLATNWGLGRLPALVVLWAERLSAPLGLGLARLVSVVDFSVAEVLIYLGVLGLVPLLVHQRRELPRLLRLVITGALWGAVIFVNLWGMQYRRPPMLERLGWEDPGPTTAEELGRLGKVAASQAKAAYRLALGTDDLGRASTGMPMAMLYPAVEQGYAVVATEAPQLGESFAWPRPSPKPLRSTFALVRFGLLGFYFPFTGEASLTIDAPGQQVPHAAAHEMAHQRGVAREDEANFMGFWVCIRSDDAYVRYSGWLFLWKQVYYELSEQREDALARGLVRQVGPGPLRDMEEAWKWWHAGEGRMRELGQAVNDTYLKVNGQEGIVSYDQSLRLMLAMGRRGGAEWAIGDDPRPADPLPGN